jgi:hypothetical protein
MMQVVVSPQGFHPFERWVPGMNGIMHSTIHEIAQQEAGKEHECITAHNKIHQPE